MARKTPADHCRTLDIGGNCITKVSLAQVNDTIVYASLEYEGQVGIIGTSLNKDKVNVETKLDLCLTGFAGTLDNRTSGRLSITSLGFYEGSTKKAKVEPAASNSASEATEDSDMLVLSLSVIGAILLLNIIGCTWWFYCR